MLLIMNDGELHTIEQVKQFLGGNKEVEFKGITAKEKYAWIEDVLVRFEYHRLKKADKGTLRQYIQKVTGYSRAQASRLVVKYKKTGRLRQANYHRYRFPCKYSVHEVELLARTDELHDWLSGPATKKIMEREYEVYGHTEFEHISRISVAHLYNLRKSSRYRTMTRRFTKTKPGVSPLGERARPRPNGQPGHIRIDTVHQGDTDDHKGVYHINAVDEVTQWEIVASTQKISESYLVPVLEMMLVQFPFTIRGFHSDNGSEFVNKVVVGLLNKMLIRFTRSRPRHSDDNALVETKNGAILRKHLGYAYIPQTCAELLTTYHKDYLNPYVNFHRPCFFSESMVDHKGKIKKKYPYRLVQTPYERLKSLLGAEHYLRPGVTFAILELFAKELSDNEFAERMVKARSNLFQQISRFTKQVV
jgi:transposase InsO family protein